MASFVSQHAAVLGTAVLWTAVFLWAAARGLSRVIRGLRARRLGESGAAQAEFVIIVIPFFLMTFGLMQMALASMARVAVTYAAFCAARAAVVVLPDESMSETVNQIGDGKNKITEFSGSTKMSLIRNAAAYAMIPASPAIDVFIENSERQWSNYLEQRAVNLGNVDIKNVNIDGSALTDALSKNETKLLSGALSAYNSYIAPSLSKGMHHDAEKSPYSIERALDNSGSGGSGTTGTMIRSLKKAVYARIATAVTLHDEKGAIKTKFGWGDPIKAKVTYLFYCQIPLANRFAGKPFYKLSKDSVSELATTELGSLSSVGFPGQFMVITAEHTLINQGHPGENDSTGAASTGSTSTGGTSTRGTSTGGASTGGSSGTRGTRGTSSRGTRH